MLEEMYHCRSCQLASTCDCNLKDSVAVQEQHWCTDPCVFCGYCLCVVQGSEVNLLVWRTAANQLFVLCKSSGWSPRPLISVLDWRRAKVPNITELGVSVQADGLFSVSIRVNIEAVDGNFTMPKNSRSSNKRSHLWDITVCCTGPFSQLQKQETRVWSVVWKSPIILWSMRKWSPSQVNIGNPAHSEC